MKSTDFAMAVYTVKAAIGADPTPQSGQATRKSFNSPGSSSRPYQDKKASDLSRDSSKGLATATYTPLRPILRTSPWEGSTAFTPLRVI